MNHIVQHISTHVESFTINDSKIFNENFKSIDNDVKYSFEKLLKYLENLINLEFTITKGLSAFHIHFEAEFTELEKLLIAEFLLIKSFLLYNSTIGESIESNADLNNIILELKNKHKSLELRCPEGASGKNGGNKIWKNWIKEKSDINKILNFYLKLNPNKKIKPNLLFNSQINFCRLVSNHFETKPFCTSVDSKYISYNVYNSSQTLNDIDNINNEIIDNLKCIILFDCERKKIMTNYSFDEIQKWNKDYGTNLNRYLIVTFGKNVDSINYIKTKIDSIKNKFKIPGHTTYTILNSEIDFLLKKGKKNSLDLNFIGISTSNIWEMFIIESTIRGLYELRSIKMMNIYSTCYNDEIKNYILNEIFSNNVQSELISSNTKMALHELSDEDIEILKNGLSNTLDLIIASNLKMNITNYNNKETVLIYDEAITNNKNLLLKISQCLNLNRFQIKNIKHWNNFEILDNLSYLFLSYRDQGKYPNYFFPNLFEIEFKNNNNTKVFLPAFLFQNHSNWANFYLARDYYNSINHPIRESYFYWDILKKSIDKLKPELKLNIEWNLENEYSNSESRETYKIKLLEHRAKTFNSSDLFILTNELKQNFRVVKIDFLTTLDDDEFNFIQSLDEIQENINIYEKIVDKNKEEAELNFIRKQFNLNDEGAGSLWKILLKNISEKDGEEKLYNQLKAHFERKGLRIVSYFHFKNSWLNPDSETIAPLYKRIFIELCEFLKIPKAYFFIVQRIRNATKQSSRKSTRQMNLLLKDLFNDGCFDYDRNPREIINKNLPYYKSNHPLDELGIDENYLTDNLVTLTELIKPELRLLELETIERVIQ
jgi:hypothetical protein